MRVSRVPRAKASTAAPADARRRGRSAPGPGSRAPSTRDTSQRRTIRRGRSPGCGEGPPDRLAAGAQRAPHGAAQVGPALGLAGRAPPAGAAQRAVEAEVGHQPAGLLELGVRCRRRSPCAAAPPGGSSARRGSARRPRPARRPSSPAASRPRCRGRWSARPGRRSSSVERRPPPPEGGEGPVVGGDVLGPAHERGPPRPVDGVAPVDAGQRPAPRRRSRPRPTGTSRPAPRRTRAKATAVDPPRALALPQAPR